MQAILTRYLGPAATRGARIIATTASGERLTLPRDYAADIEVDHRRVAEALRDRLGWRGVMHCGSTASGYAFVFAAGRA
jgi:hypothetical protein